MPHETAFIFISITDSLNRVKLDISMTGMTSRACMYLSGDKSAAQGEHTDVNNKL